MLQEDIEKTPNMVDYLAAAALSYGVVFFCLKIISEIAVPVVITYLVYYLGVAGTTYMICQKTTRNQFPVAMKSAIFSWVFTTVCLITFVSEDSLGFFVTILILFLLGGFTTSVITMRQRLSRSG